MHLPRQCEPVQRALFGRPFVSRGDGSASELTDANEQALRASDYGVLPSAINWDQILRSSTISPTIPIFDSLL
jgi:hypothetical protein